MPYVVFWMEAPGVPACREFGDAEMTASHEHMQTLRRQGKRYVAMASENPDSVGQAGVDSVEGGRLPDGHVYDFDKRHRGAGPTKK